MFGGKPIFHLVISTLLIIQDVERCWVTAGNNIIDGSPEGGDLSTGGVDPTFDGTKSASKLAVQVKVQVNSDDENNEQVIVNQDVLFLLGSGGFGGKRPSPQDKPSPSGLKSEVIFFAVSGLLSSSPDLLKDVNGAIQYNITSDGEVARVWTVELHAERSVFEGELKSGEPNATITISDEDFFALAYGSLEFETALVAGQIQIKGQVMLVMTVLPSFVSFFKGRL